MDWPGYIPRPKLHIEAPQLHSHTTRGYDRPTCRVDGHFSFFEPAPHSFTRIDEVK